jgi:heme exporter protein B
VRFLWLLKKDIKSEFRTKFALSALVLFIFTSIILIYFQISGEKPGVKIVSGLYWVIYFFAALTGLSRSFIQEEERGTGFFLQAAMPLESIWLGKLFFNIILSLIINASCTILFSLFIPNFNIENISALIFGNIVGGIAIASSLTILSALISKASSKNSILPVMAFPVILPAIITASNIMTISLGEPLGRSLEGQFINLELYIGIVISSSWVLFDHIWKD